VASEVDPGSPEQQAAEALREAVRRIDAEREYIQGQPGPNEAFEKLLANPADPDALRDVIRELDDPADKCDQGPGCDCPFHAMHEIELRQRRRLISLSDGFSLAPGECTACGLDDQPVKGPPGAELCRFCDELRIAAPPQQPWCTGMPPVTFWASARFIARCVPVWAGWPVWAAGVFLLTSGHPVPAVACLVCALICWRR
jgi:hypothetical protein